MATIYEFAGVLKGQSGKVREPLVLEATKYLPSLDGKSWDDTKANASLTDTQRLLIKRAKLDVNIILRESETTTKYEMFQRLNTGGSQLSDQEVRNCVLIMTNAKMFKWMRELADDSNFRECIGLSERALEESYDMELVSRFLVFSRLREKELANFRDLRDFLTDRIAEKAEQENFEYDKTLGAFATTFRIIHDSLGFDAFRRYDVEKNGSTAVFSYRHTRSSLSV